MPTTPVTPMVPQPRSTPSMNLLSYNTDDSSDSDIIVSDSDPNDDLDENINLETNRNHNTSTSTSSAHTNQIPTHLQPIRHNTAFQQNSAFFNSSSSASSSGFSSPARFDDTSDSINIDSDSDSDQNDSIDIISDNESDSGLNSTDYNSNPASEKYFSNDDDYDGDNDNALVPRIGTSKLTYQPGISSSSSSSHSRSTSSLSSLNSNTINGTAPLFAVAAAASHLDSNSPTINNLATFSLSDRAHQNFGDTSADEDFFSIHNNSNSTTLNLSEIIDQEQNNRFSSPTSSPSDLPLIPSSASNTTLTHLTPSDPDSVSLHRNHAEPSLGSSQYTSGSESGTTGIPADSSSALSFSYASHASKTSPTQSPTLDHDNIFHSDSSQFPSTLLSSTTPSPSLILERPAIFNEGPLSTMTQPDKLPPPPSKRKTSGVLSMAARFEQQESDPSPPPRNFYTGRARKSSISTPFSSLTSNASSRTSSIPGTSIFGEKAEPSQAKSPSLVSPISKRVPISIPSTFTGADSSSTFTPPALKPTSSPFSLRKSVAPLVRSKKEVSDEVPEPSADTELPSTAELENVPESMDSSSDPAQISTKSPILTGIDETEKSRDLVPPVVDATVPHLDTPATTIDPDTVDTPVLNQAAVVAVPSDSLTDLHSPVDSTLPSSSPASVERSPEADPVLELPKNFSPSADSAPTIGSPESTGETPVPLTSSFDNITTSPLVNHLPSQDPSSSVLLSSDEFPSTDIPRSSTESPTHPDSDITSAPLVAPISLSTVETTHQALPVVDSLSPTNSFVSLTDSFVSTVDEINLKSKSAESAEPAQPTSLVSSSSLTHSSPNKASSPLPSSSLPDSLALDPQPGSAVSSPSAVPVSSPKSPAESLSALSSHSPVLESSQAVAPLSPLPKSLSSSLHSESDPISPTGSLWSPQSASQWSATASHFSLSNSHLGEAASPPGSLSSSVFRSLTGLTSMPPSIPVDASLSATVASNSPDSSLESSSSSSSDDENDDIDDIDNEEFQPALDSSSLLRSVPSDEHAPSTILPTTPVVSAEEAPEFVDSVQSPPGTSPSSSLSISLPELAPQIATTTGHIVSAPPADNSPSSASSSAASLKSAAESPLASPQLRASSPVDSPELAASSPVRSPHLATSSPLTAPQIGDSSPITHSQPSASSPVTSLRPAEVSPVSSPQIEAPSPVARSGPAASSSAISPQLAASSLLSHTKSSVSLELPSRDSTSPVKEPSAASPPSAQRSPSAGQWSPEPLSSPESPPRADAVTPKAEHFSLPSSPSDAVAVPRSPSSSVLRSPIGLISAPDSLPPDSFVVTNSLSPHAPVAVEVASRELSPETVQKSHSSVKSLSLNESSPSIITSKAVTDTLISSQIPPSTSLFVSVPNSPEAISEAIPEPSSPLPSERLLPTALPVSSPALHPPQSPQSSRDSVHSTVLGEDSEADVETRTFESPVVPASSTTPFSLPESHEIAEGSTASHEAVLPRALDTTVGLAPELPFRSSGEYDASNSLDISPQSPVDSLSSDGSFASASPVAYSHPPAVLPDLSSSEHIHTSADDEIEFHSGSYRDDHVDSPRPSSRSPSLDLPESSEVTITTIDTSPPASQHTPVDSSAFGDPVKNDEITVTSPKPASQPSVAPLSFETFSEPALPSPDSPLASVTMSKEEGDPLQSSTRAGPEPESESDSDSSEASFNSAASSPQAPTFALADSTEFATTSSVTPSEQGSDSPTTSHFAEPVIPLAAAASVAAVATAASFSPSISASPELAPVQNPWSSDAVLNPPVVVHSHVASSPSEIASFDFDTPSTVPKTPEHISVPREVSTQTRVTSPSPVSSVSSVVHTPAATDLAPESELRISTEAVSHSSFSEESLKDDWSNLSRSEIAEIPLDSPEAPAPRSPDDSFVFPAVPAAAALTAIPEMPLSFASGKPLPPSPDDTFTKPLPASPGKFDSVAEESSGESLSRSLGDSSEYLNIAPAEAGLINPIISQKSPAVPTKPYITSDVEQPHSFSSDVIPVSRRTPSVTLKPIVKEAPPVPQEEEQLIFAVCVVGFHHTHGPQVEYWKGRDGDQSKLWPNLPFQSLPDGSHSHEENFCYFTMLYDEVNRTAPISVPTRDRAGNVIEEAPNMDNVTTLFGISCNRQINSEDLKDRPADVTRSTVHKSVVVIARKPIFGPIREKLAVITRAFFQQGDFRDVSLIDNLYDNLNQLFSVKLDENVLYVGMSLRELIYRLRSNVLVLLKALLLEKKIIFYSKSTEVLCASQFSLISLVPALLDHLEDCSSPLLSKFEHTVKKPTSLRSSDRKSLLAFMGLPLQPFAEGGMFNPYVPLQQFNELKAPETKYFLVGSTNSLLIENCPADIIVQMDQSTVEIKNSKLKNLLALSASDKKWMDYIVQAVVDTWDPEDPWRPKGLGFHGSEDFVRQQFEDYIMGLMSSVKYDSFLSRFGNSPPKTMLLREVNGNPMKLFNQNWVQEWRSTTNFRIFSKITDNEVFDIVEPRHMVSTLSVNEAHQRSLSLLSHTSQASQDLKDKRSSIPAPARSAKSWGSFWWRGANDQGKGSAQHTKTNSTDPQSNLEVSSPKSTAPSSLASSSSLQNSPSVKDGDSVVRSSGSPDDDSSFVSKNSRAEANRNRTNTVSTTQSVNLSPVHSRGSSTSSSQRSSTTPSSGIFKGWSLWGGAGSRKSGSLNKSNSTQRLSQQHLPPSGHNPFAATSSVPSSSTDITSQSSDSNTNGSLHNSSRSVSSPVALSRGLSDHHRDPFSPMEAPDSPPISFASARRFGAPSS